MTALEKALDALYELVGPDHRLTIRWLSIEYARLQLADVAGEDSRHDDSLDLLGQLAGALQAFADPYVSLQIDDI